MHVGEQLVTAMHVADPVKAQAWRRRRFPDLHAPSLPSRSGRRGAMLSGRPGEIR
jgi:hypothetical protein